MAAGLHDQAGLDNQDIVGAGDGGQPMRDHQGAAPLAQFGERLLHMARGFRIQRRGRLIEQNDRRVLISARAMATRWR